MTTDDLAKQLAEIQRRLRGLKATRPANASQIASLIRQYDLSASIPGSGLATWDLEIVASGDPLVIAIASAITTDDIILPVGVGSWSLSGNTATSEITAYNTELVTKTVLVTVNIWALNGLTASIVRTL